MKNVTLVYGEKPALKNVSLSIEPQTKTAIIGPTAAGKTQLLNIADLYVLRYHLAFLKGDKPGMDREAALAVSHAGGAGLDVAPGVPCAGSFRPRSTGQKYVTQSRRGGSEGRRPGKDGGYYCRGSCVGRVLRQRADRESRRDEGARAIRSRDVEYGAAFALALSGDVLQSQSIANDLEKRFPQDTTVQFSYLPALRGLFALNRGDTTQAVEQLQTAAPYDLAVPGITFFWFFGALYPDYVRGEAYLAAHQGNQAAAEFQKILDHRGLVLADPMGAMARLQLARALALSGDKVKAKATYQDFLMLWQGADSDIPILRQAKTEYAGL